MFVFWRAEYNSHSLADRRTNFAHAHLKDNWSGYSKPWDDQAIYIIISISAKILDEKLCFLSFLILHCLQCLSNLETNMFRKHQKERDYKISMKRIYLYYQVEA